MIADLRQRAEERARLCRLHGDDETAAAIADLLAAWGRDRAIADAARALRVAEKAGAFAARGYDYSAADGCSNRARVFRADLDAAIDKSVDPDTGPA